MSLEVLWSFMQSDEAVVSLSVKAALEDAQAHFSALCALKMSEVCAVSQGTLSRLCTVKKILLPHVKCSL